MMFENIAIIGSSGTIGQSFVHLLAKSYPQASIHAISSKKLAVISNINDHVFTHQIDYNSEQSIEIIANLITNTHPLDLVIITNGMLHNQQIKPEKSLKELSTENFKQLFQVNTILPAILGKYFIPKLAKHKKAVFAVLSARIGSISDNKLGGWYGYRASKAALNMIIKTMAIELARRNKNAVIVALHPGTVDSNLSKPFQASVSQQKLFSARYSTEKLLLILQNATSEDSGKLFAWDGQEILP